LYPFEENESNVEEYKEIFKKVKELLKSVSEEESAMFKIIEYFLSRLEISYEEYKLAIRSNLKKPQVFLRRQFSVRLLNAYNRNILGLHLSEASEGNVFINTCYLDKRVRIVRSNRELEQLPANSTDIFERNLLDRYVQRHEQLESLCLAEFAAWFKFSKLNARSEQ